MDAEHGARPRRAKNPIGYRSGRVKAREDRGELAGEPVTEASALQFAPYVGRSVDALSELAFGESRVRTALDAGTTGKQHAHNASQSRRPGSRGLLDVLDKEQPARG